MSDPLAEASLKASQTVRAKLAKAQRHNVEQDKIIGELEAELDKAKADLREARGDYQRLIDWLGPDYQDTKQEIRDELWRQFVRQAIQSWSELENATELNDIMDGRICEVEEKWAEYKADSERLDKLERFCLREGCFLFGHREGGFEIKQDVLIDDYEPASEGRDFREAIDKLEEQP